LINAHTKLLENLTTISVGLRACIEKDELFPELNENIIPESNEKIISTHLSALELLPVLLEVINHSYTIKLEELGREREEQTMDLNSFICNRSAV
jgi:hypothetical protein